MPSRNKRNKNRANAQATSGANASKNGANAVKISDDSGEKAIFSTESELQPDLTSTISDAKDKLEELQQSVDAIKASISQVNAVTPEVIETKSTEDLSTSDQKPDSTETQTMKKKRNRNRNRKKNNLTSANESGVSSTSDTHENSPTPIAIPIPTGDVIKSEIKEESSQAESDVSLENVKIDPNVSEGVERSPEVSVETPTAVEESVKAKDEPNVVIEELKFIAEEVKITEIEAIIGDVETKPTEETKVEEVKTVEIQVKADEEPIPPKESSNNELQPEESDKRSKENEKQKKSRKNANNNYQKGKLDTNAPANQQMNVKNQIETEPEKNEPKEDPIEVEKLSPEAKSKTNDNNNNKNTKPSKKSPKANKKMQPAESKSVETAPAPSQLVEQTIAEPTEVIVSKAVEKVIETIQDVCENIDVPRTVAEEIAKPTENKEAVDVKIDQIDGIEATQVIEVQSENVTQVAQVQDQPEEDKSDPNPESSVPASKKSDIAPAIQQTISSKESKKPKGKKSPPQNNKPIPQNNNMQPKSVDVGEKVLEAKPETKPTSSEMKEEMVKQIETAVEISAPLPPPTPPEISSETAPIELQIETNLQANDKPTEMLEVKNEIENSVLDQQINLKSSTENITKDESKLVSDVHPKAEPELKKTELCVMATDEVTNTPASSPIMTTPAPEPAKKLTQQEDETAKIWKILEEASKSLEPVEIQMDDDPVPIAIVDVPVESTTPIVCLSKDEQQIEEETKDLVTLLESKEPSKDAQTKTAKGKENKQQPKPSSPTKAVDAQQRKSTEPKKKDTKLAQKNAKSSKQSQPQPQPHDSPPAEKMPEKLVEKKSEKTPEKMPNKTPPFEISGGSMSLADDDVPLDMSILPDQIDVPEISTESKNVQGSDFVPSVEQTAVETESLVTETIAQVGSEQPREAKSESKSPINSNEELKSNSAKLMPEPKTQSPDVKTVPPQDGEKTPVDGGREIKSASSSKSTSPTKESDKRNRTNSNGKQKELNAKNLQQKPTQNSKKSNGKPTIPPKPDHLMSSQMKKSQGNGSKSAKTEKILVLTNADDDDSEDDYIEYKFMPRQVFISTICQSCKKPTKSTERVLCQLCQMVSYCCTDHVTKDEPIHKDLCAALQEISKKRGGHIYNNARILNNNDYRSLRVHTLNLCENFLKRPLQTFEREILLFPRICLTATCREWRQNLLSDCENCGQAFYCTAQPDHLNETHQRWCKSVALYRNLVVTQSISGRIEPNLPSRIQSKPYTLPPTIADVFKDLYKNISAIKDECMFATLTQLATAPVTAYFAAQKADQTIGEKFTIHLIGAELQFEADVLDIWETFFLHLAHNLMELTIVFCGPELNAENIPLDIISRIRMCRTCRQNCRIVKFDFQCAKYYHEYAKSSGYSKPDLLCFFNPGFHHINSLNGLDTWSETIKIASNSDCPVVVTSYTEYESPRDLDRFLKESANYGKQMNLIHGPEFNAYSSQRPERNFISDEIVPLIFKNYFCFVLK